MWRHLLNTPGAKIINVFRACLGAQFTICAQKLRNFVLFSTVSFRFVLSRVCVFLYSLGPWCQFKMMSSKCPYRSKHHVIILTVNVYSRETLYITQSKHDMLFTGTRINIVPNSANLRCFDGDLWWFAYKASHRKSPQTTTETS